jgi:hypothetical protein
LRNKRRNPRAGASNGHAGRPRLLDRHERRGPAGKCHVLHEIDRVVHALVSLLRLPEVMRAGGNAGKKTQDDCGCKLWFNFEQNAQASANQYGTGRLDGKIRFRNSFCGSVVGQPARLLEVLIPFITKNPPKSRRPRRNSTRMISCKETFRFWPVRRRRMSC